MFLNNCGTVLNRATVKSQKIKKPKLKYALY